MRLTLLNHIIDKYKMTKKQAEILIRTGLVFVNDEIIFTPGTFLPKKFNIIIKNKKKYVSRGSTKLLKAFEIYKIDVKNKITLDIGSSTGGFTQVLLEKEAKKIYALDSGTNQLSYFLRSNDKVIDFENTNLKEIKPGLFKDKIDFFVCDVSFISLKWVFKVMNDISVNEGVVLIKPQFEANSNQIIKGGIAPLEIHKEIIEKVIFFALEYGYTLENIKESPIKGKISRNIEYLAYVWRKNAR
ncbi:MAG: TlyA family RNA methyltransferase [Mollicutes bacterium PWAP]|nr:TlyA family RNA methyltransferase [Mollicutes bacterium PWAP]